MSFIAIFYYNATILYSYEHDELIQIA